MLEISKENIERRVNYFRPFISKGFHGYYSIYFLDYNTGKRNKKSTHSQKQSQAIKALENFNLSYYTNRNSLKIRNIADLKNIILQYNQKIYSKSTLDTYERSLNNFTKVIGDRPLELVTFNEVEYFKTQRIKEVSATSVNIELRSLRAAFSYALRCGTIAANPFLGLRQVPVPQEERKVFTQDEIAQLLNAIDIQEIKDIVIFALTLGCRLGEIINIQISDLDMINRRIEIKNKKDFLLKTRKNRVIPMTDSIYELFMSLRKKGNNSNVIELSSASDYLFTNKYNIKLNRDYVSKTFKRFVNKCGFDPKLCFKSLRHTALSRMANNNVPLNIVKEIAGHSELKTTAIYLHVDLEEMRKKLNSIEMKY